MLLFYFKKLIKIIKITNSLFLQHKNYVYLCIVIKLMKLGEKVETDVETGETSSKFFRIKVKKHSINFILLFESILPIIEDLKSEMGVLVILIMGSEISKGVCYVPAGVRKEMADKLGLKLNTFNTQLHRLKKKGIIELEDNVVTLNPNYFWKGSIIDREIAIKNKVRKIITTHEITSTEGEGIL